jgi:hypothetical protein
MYQGNQRMRLATPKSRFQAMNNRHGVVSSETAKDLGKCHAKSFCGIGRRLEELLGIRVERVDWRGLAALAIYDLTQAGREDF